MLTVPNAHPPLPMRKGSWRHRTMSKKRRALSARRHSSPAAPGAFGNAIERVCEKLVGLFTSPVNGGLTPLHQQQKVKKKKSGFLGKGGEGIL